MTQTKKSFDEFLRENGTSLAKFIKNCDDKEPYCQGFTTLNEIVRYRYGSTNIKTIIGSSFIWLNTPEGSNFWQEISERWKTFIDLSDKRYIKNIPLGEAQFGIKLEEYPFNEELL